MRVADWTRLLADLPRFQELLDVRNGCVAWQSVAEEARPVLLAGLYRREPRRILVIAPNHDRALKWQARLALCGVPEIAIRQLPSGTSALFEDATPEHVALSDRIGALRSLVEDSPSIVIATPAAALERTLPADLLSEAFVTLKVGQTIDPDRLVRRLVRLGYEVQEPVRMPGHFSKRGGILDIYVMGRDLPVRIELFGDEIESLRQFDPVGQRSVGPIPAISLSPSRETLYPRDIADFATLLTQTLELEAAGLDEESARRLEELVQSDLHAISNRTFFDRLDLYRPFIHPESGCAVDLLGEEGLLVLEEPIELEGIAERAYQELGQALEARHARGEILHSTAGDFQLPAEHFASSGRLIAMSSMNALPEWLTVDKTEDVNAVSLDPYRGRADALVGTLKNWRGHEFTVGVCTDQPNRAKAMLSGVEVFVLEGPGLGGSAGLGVATESESPADSGAGPAVAVGPEMPKPPPGFYLLHGNLAGGFALPDDKLAFLTDAELFGVGRLRLPTKRFLEGAPVATVLDLKPGDYVVHIQFGIGVYQGLVKRTVDGVEKEFLYIEYAAPDKLFVPAEQLDRVQKYLNPGDAAPKINRLHGQEWTRTLSKAKEEARFFAQELVKLYAQRRTVKRRPFGPDTPWQSEMESTFPWVETPSQLTAIRDCKKDMQEDFPMDRLVCGDVGFGKTEVAIRAAFKAVQAGRQVAVLCPTTILSEQHFRNFDERMSSFGVKIDLVNRFRTAAEKRQIMEGVKSGRIDVLIGTHALLGKEVAFKDLGLLIVDEEQKFGVKQKEEIKKLRVEVDVLTLSATPIPRTLSMALMDIRQMSLINDPPPGRLPIRTFLRPFSGEVIREAVLRELARGGQVFYVYNRVDGIYHVAERLRKLVPTARIAIGHGQMTEKELEPVMMGFINGEVDVLLSTTIVESGLDISNANTLIVENADRFGLAQLYQLRGRVGRSDRQAYAYFLFQSGKTLTEGATARLEALQEFTSLGSGYSLAFRDLQIRGAGDLLGAKQSGSMAAVGYELYTQLINEAVQMLKAAADGEAPPMTLDEALASMEPLPSLDLPVAALLPDAYIPDQAQRLYAYQRLMSARTPASLAEVKADVEDRYGQLPEPAANAFAIVQVRMKMRALGMDKADGLGGRLSVTFKDLKAVPPMALRLMGRRNKECYMTREALIWPYSGAPVKAAERLVETFELCLREVEEARAGV